MQNSKNSNTDYDVVIVGASVGGSIAAILFAQEGLRVALIEHHKDITAYKKVCTHYIQPNAVPVLQRAGLAEQIEAAGGIRNGGQAWTRWGWLGAGARKGEDAYGYSIRREVLDPILRRQAAATPAVDFRPGTSLRDLIYEGDRVVGIQAQQEGRQTVEIRARLVVGADGRNSPTAKLAELPVRKYTNNRFMYFAYFRNLPLATGLRNQVWYLEPEVAYALPNDNELTLLACAPSKSNLAEFKKDIQGNFIKFFEDLPNGPNLQAAEQVSDVIGMLDIPLISREAVAPGLALIGDAALAPDPVWGNGIGWAVQAAEWLVDSAGASLKSGRPGGVDKALEQYRRKHHAAFAERFARDVDFARARPFNIFERLMYAAAAHEPKIGQYTGPHTTRLADIRYFPSPQAIGQALRVMLTVHLKALRKAIWRPYERVQHSPTK